MEDYYEYLDSNGVTTLYKLIKDDTVALIDSYSVTLNGITTTLDNHVNNADIHTPITTIEGMIDTAVGSLNYATPDYVDTKISGLVNSAPETLDTLKELSDALGNDPNFATTVANQIGSKASKDDVYTKLETDTLLEGKANSVHSHVVSDITDFPTIPTKTSQLINDSGFLTSSSGVITSVSWNDITSKPSFSDIAISGSYNDLVDTPTIPTKTSELANDSGYITSVSWSDITNKPNFSTVATSGSYTDLSNTPTIPTKVSQLENDMGFGTGGDTSDCVHKSGDETIAGVKKFTSDIVRKYTAVDITTTPTSDMQSRINFTDKNDKIIAYIQYAQKTNGVNYIGLRVRDKNSTTYGVQLNTNKEFVPFGNNSYSLGSSSYKWSKVYSDDVVHTSGDENINGIKTFTSMLKISQGTLQVGSDTGYSVTYSWSGDITSKQPSGTYNIALPKANGTLALTSDINSKANDSDVVHKSGDETIAGVKTFTASPFVSNYAVTNGYFTRLNQIARNEVPSQIYHSAFRVFDKNSKTLGEYCVEKSTSGSSLLHMDVHTEDSEGNDIMESVYLNLSNDGSTVSFHPAKDNRTDLGMAHYKWAKIYSDDVVHTSGNEHINGTKWFSNTISRHADLTTSTAEQVYNFYDTNANSCGHIFNNVHWGGDCIYNRHGAYNNKSGKTMEILIASNDAGFGMISVEGTATKGNLETVTSATGYTGIATMGWVNNPSTSTNVVHRSGDENIAGNKLFGDKIICTRFTHYINNSHIYLAGGSEWDKGATLSLHGEESNDAGAFVISSKDKTRTLYFVGRPDGTLQWAGQNLTTTTFVKGTNYWYRKHSDGFIEMGGIGNASIMESINKVTLPTPFSNTNYVVTGSSTFRADIVFGVSSKTTTYFYCGLSQPSITWATGTFSWYACGY